MPSPRRWAWATSACGRLVEATAGIEGRLTTWFYATDEGDVAQGVPPTHESPPGVSLAAVLLISL